MHEKVACAVESLELDLRTKVSATAIASWFKSPGLKPHFDNSDVFVTQIAGHKRWLVYEPSIRNPQKGSSINDRPTTNLYLQATLGSGDLLYVPRGWWHEAIPVDEPTLHISFMTWHATGASFLNWMLDDLSARDELREAVPRFRPLDRRGSYFDSLRQIVVEALATTSLEQYIDCLDEDLPSRFRPSLPWAVMPQSAPLGSGTWIHWMRPHGPEFECTESGTPSKRDTATIACPVELRSVVEQIFCQRRVTLGALLINRPISYRNEIEHLVHSMVMSGHVYLSEFSW
jgi:JmjC domain